MGIRGEVFNLDGKIAGAVPPVGQPDGIPFEIGAAWPETSRFPAWTDMMVDDTVLPSIRLCDVGKDPGIAIATGMMHEITLQGQEFVFWPEVIGGR